MTRSGWVALHGRIVGNPMCWVTDYYWDGVYHADKRYAVRSGFKHSDSDDFNVGHVVDGVLVWFGWMDKQFMDLEDYEEPAKQHGWQMPATVKS
jgi:hypothetical protein